MAVRTRLIVGLFWVSTLSCHAAEQPWTLSRDGVALRGQVVVLPQWIRADEGYACSPALAVTPGGDALVTSNVVPTLWKVDARTLRVTVHRLELDADASKDVGFSSLRYSAGERAWIAFSAIQGSTWRIDADLKRARKIADNPVWRTACVIE